ncbi:calcium-activated chloride channel regulator 1-like [Leucoraja erinacea]|uniref:calcium-activated chloride channel regulator 1-like n=1 Tax=Leucoraja erinaceus TaxID=7782 RepID=UPI002455F776|nr:calcium-activated chloride channel regulator 1-like [Leucoraja erinacea]
MQVPSLVFCYLLSICVIKCSRVTLVNNGYQDIVFAINPSVQYNDKLIESIQEMVTEASNYLHQATKYQLYFSDVKILLPASWALNSSLVQSRTHESYEKADVIIAESYLKHGDAPYTLQYGGCGEMGRYIHFTPKFILNEKITSVYGPKGRVLVHEWARFRWGVFNEHNDLIPFYKSSNRTSECINISMCSFLIIILTFRCSLSIRGMTAECNGSLCSLCTIDKSTGLPNKECQFFPEKNQMSSSSIMYLQGLPNVDKFCDNTTHNPEAPNMQNKMCNYKSTWDVISKSEDVQNISSPHNGSVKPNFTLLQAKNRVLCLVLDVSGSMSSRNRIDRLRQAAEIFLQQIAETGSQAGIITFNYSASIQTHLKMIVSDITREELVKLLLARAYGGTSICAGIRSGFEVLRGDDNATKGDEIILLTDGIDQQISSCFQEVEESGSVIHTIALGPTAAKELEELSAMTGGLQFAATDNLNTSGLIDSFTGLVSENGDSSQQTIQLENAGINIDKNTWLNGTVIIDKSIGNDTTFVVTWEAQTPDVFVYDPNGTIYNNDDFKINQTVHIARLKIKGTAQTGPWIYSILNLGGDQVITVTVTSRAADANIPPIKVTVHISRKDSTNPMIIYVEVSHGFLPVLYANVTAIIERPSGPPVGLQLSDDGLGADIVRNDGIYSKYFLSLNERGRYSAKVRVQGSEGTTRITFTTEGQAMPIPGYSENVRNPSALAPDSRMFPWHDFPATPRPLQSRFDEVSRTEQVHAFLFYSGNIEVIPQQPLVNKTDLDGISGDFNRVQAGGTISVPSGTSTIDFPPCKITDFQATIVKNKIELEWTAPGGDYDQGSGNCCWACKDAYNDFFPFSEYYINTNINIQFFYFLFVASRYEMRMSKNLLQLRDYFSKASLVNLTGMHPQPYGSRDVVRITPENQYIQNGTTIYFAVRAYDEGNQSSEVSNIARVSFFVPKVEPIVEPIVEPVVKPNYDYTPQKAWIAAVVVGIVCLVVGPIICIVHGIVPKKVSVGS